jgi:ATP-dependent phosphoenolpyruvate carboxykinase
VSLHCELSARAAMTQLISNDEHCWGPNGGFRGEIELHNMNYVGSRCKLRVELSRDAKWAPIGDDEHCWGPNGED